MAILPVWPPASVPWATTMSQPASTAAMAWRTLPHMLTTSTLRLWHRSTTSRGTPRPATNTEPPPSMMSVTLAAMSPGRGGEQVDAEGLDGELADLGDLVAHLLGAHGGGAHAPEAAGLAHGGDEPVVRHPAHPGQHHRVLDLQDVRRVACAWGMARAILTAWSSSARRGEGRDTSGGLRCPGHADMATPPRVPWAQLRLGGPPVEVGGPIGLTGVNLGSLRFGVVAPP